MNWSELDQWTVHTETCGSCHFVDDKSGNLQGCCCPSWMGPWR